MGDPVEYKMSIGGRTATFKTDSDMKKIRVTKKQKEALDQACMALAWQNFPEGVAFDAFSAVLRACEQTTTEPTPEEKAAALAKAEYAAIEAEREKLKPYGYVEKAYVSGSTYTDQIVLSAVRVLEKRIVLAVAEAFDGMNAATRFRESLERTAGVNLP